jgi:hypothetical protein
MWPAGKKMSANRSANQAFFFSPAKQEKTFKLKIMKTLIAFLFFISLNFQQLLAQGTGGLFNQQSSRVKLMLAQIAAYQTLLQGLKRGYSITENGLNTAGELKGGTFELHQAYFNSLQQVNPAISSNPKAKAIAGMQWQIDQAFTRELAWQQQQKILTPTEMGYIRQVHGNLREKCREDTCELSQVLTPGKLQLSDRQRLQRVDLIYAGMAGKAAFSISFTTRCRQMAMARQRARGNNDRLKILYGIQ